MSQISSKYVQQFERSQYMCLMKIVKVSDPYVETSCIFFCIKNIINAEMWT